MIEMLVGDVAYIDDEYVLLNVNSVGYRVFMAPSTLNKLKIKDNVGIWTYLSVRENSMELYGFKTRDELEFFNMLIGISGVGPKSALSILALENVETLSSAISDGNTEYLTKISGIGKKSAERIVMELKDKIEKNTKSRALNEDRDVMDALVQMGYSETQIRSILKQIPCDIKDSGKRIKEALKLLSTNKI